MEKNTMHIAQESIF